MKHLLRSKQTGRFVSPPNIVSGRLYGYKGAVVRAKKLCNNGMRLVSYHKTLNGFVRDADLEVIPKEKVEQYLNEV